MMGAVRHFLRGRTLGTPHRRAIFKKARKYSEERRESKSLPLCGKEQRSRGERIWTVGHGMELLKMV